MVGSKLLKKTLQTLVVQEWKKLLKALVPLLIAGEIYIQLGETGGCTSGGEPEAINNKSWIAYANGSFNLLDNTKSDWPVNWVKWYGANAFVQYYNLDLPTEAQWEYAARGWSAIAISYRRWHFVCCQKPITMVMLQVYMIQMVIR